MDIIDSKKVKVFTSLELKDVLENENTYEYIYLANNITLDQPININKDKVTIDGTYNGIRYKLTGMDSSEVSDTIILNSNNKEIQIKNIDIESTNTNGLFYTSNQINVLIIYNNIKYTGIKINNNPYGSTKIIDSIITIEETNSVTPQEVCCSKDVILGGSTTIISSAAGPIFIFRIDVSSSLVIMCRSNILLTSSTNSLMNGTNKLNFTILHDANVNIITNNGFAGYSVHGSNDVLIDERASLSFIENNHKRVPMWSVFGNFTMKKDSSLEVINSYENTPTDNYNIHFKGTNSKLILDNPKSVKFYTKNANIIYTNNLLEFDIKCTRFNLWNDAKELTQAGDINDLPDYSWYKNDDLFELTGTISSTDTVIASHNLTLEELNYLPDINNLFFQSKKVFSIGDFNMNIHPINNSLKKISGHTYANTDVYIKYNDISEIVSSDSDGLFEYNYISDIDDNTEIEIISADPNGFIYKTRKVKMPYDGELSIMECTNFFEFVFTPVLGENFIFQKNKSLVIKVVDSRISKNDWNILASLDGTFKSQGGYLLEDALIFKDFDNNSIILSNQPQIIYSHDVNDELINIEWSKEKGPLLDLTNSYLEVNEEYFACVNFKLEG